MPGVLAELFCLCNIFSHLEKTENIPQTAFKLISEQKERAEWVFDELHLQLEAVGAPLRPHMSTGWTWQDVKAAFRYLKA